MKKVFFNLTISLSLIFFSAGCSKTAGQAELNFDRQLKIGQTSLLVALADSEQERELGLSFQKTLAENHGMLFVFDKPQTPSFWMKDMNFDLDLIWIKQNKVIGITKNVPAPGSCAKRNLNCAPLPLYAPPGEVDLVLETISGFAEKNNITVGDDVILN